MRKQRYVAVSLFCVCLGIGSSVLLPSVAGETMLQCCAHDEQGEYIQQGNALPGNPWFKNGGWYIGSPYLWDQLDQEECTWV